MKHILYIGWLGFNNLGDEMMWDIFRSLADQHLNPEEYKITPSLPDVNTKKLNSYDLVVLGGGSLIIPPTIGILFNAIKKNKKIIIWGSGHDGLAKERLEVLIGKKKRSFEHLLTPSFEEVLVTVIENTNYAGVRGPLTLQILQEIGANMNKVEISGDPGLLLEYDEANDNFDNLFPYNYMWKPGENIVGINWGTSYNNIYGKNEARVEDCLARIGKILLRQGYKIFIYTVWGEDINPSTRLYDKIGDSENVKFTPNLYNQYDLMNIVQKCCFTINFKLHANVISAAANVPFIALAYRFKTFDFAASLDLNKLVVSTDSPAIEEDILGLIPYVTENRQIIIGQFKKYRETYREKLEVVFENIIKDEKDT